MYNLQTLSEKLYFNSSINFILLPKSAVTISWSGNSSFLLLFLIYFCALTIVCPILIFIIDFIKGFAIGIYIPTIFCVFGFGNGLLVLFLLVILPNLIYVPALIYSFCSSLNFNYNILNSKEKSFLQIFLKERINLVFIISIILLSVVVEQLLSTFVISIYQNLA